MATVAFGVRFALDSNRSASNTARRIIAHDPNRGTPNNAHDPNHKVLNNAHDPNRKVLNNARVGMIPATGNCHKSFSRKDLRQKGYPACVTPSLASTYEDSHSTRRAKLTGFLLIV